MRAGEGDRPGQGGAHRLPDSGRAGRRPRCPAPTGRTADRRPARTAAAAREATARPGPARRGAPVAPAGPRSAASGPDGGEEEPGEPGRAAVEAGHAAEGAAAPGARERGGRVRWTTRHASRVVDRGWAARTDWWEASAVDYAEHSNPSWIDFARSQTATAGIALWCELRPPVGDDPRSRSHGSGRIARRRQGSRHPPDAATENHTESAPVRPAVKVGATAVRVRHTGEPHGSRHHAPAARERRPLRAPDPSLEPEDEALHHDRAQRHLHHRPAAVAGLHRPLLRVRQGDRRPGRHRHVRRHQEAGPGGDRRAGDPRRHALRQPALARRHAHQLPDRAPAHQPPQGARRDRLRRRGRQQPHEEGAPPDAPRAGQARTRPSAVSAR